MSTYASLSKEAQASAVATEGVPDCVSFAVPQSRSSRAVLMALSAAIGVAVGLGGSHFFPETQIAIWLVAGVALMGGLLSTWSPCGYSSLTLLRPRGHEYSLRSVVGYVPTLVLHGLGYAFGAVVLGGVLAGIGYMLGLDNYVTTGAVVLAVVAVLYGAHQFGFLRVPYPQRRAQVPHDARQRFPIEAIGLLYGVSLGLNYLTYVQTPILYLVTALAALSGNVTTAIALFAIFNLGRFLPMLINLLPVTDRSVTAWLARRQEAAATFDGALLVGSGAAILAMYLA